MKLNLLLSLICFAAIQTHAQKFKIDTLQYKGSDKNLINLVILGDGYTGNELNFYADDARRFTDYFFLTEPFRQYINYFNVYAIHTISEESGAIHPNNSQDCPTENEIDLSKLPARYNKFNRNDVMPTSQPKTIFGSEFDAFGIHRLVVPSKTEKLKEVLQQHIPNYTQVVILVNSPFYGGSGGEFATTTVNYKSNDIAVHEIGHSFGLLADEYWAGNQYAYNRSNFTNDPTDVPWKHWVGENGIGVYSYGNKGSKSNWYRPHEYCKMQYLVAPFCSVCQEEIVEVIHKKTNPILVSKPAEKSIKSDSIQLFSLKLAKPSPNSLKVNWFLNGKNIANNVDSIYMNKGSFVQGENKLKAEVIDTTLLVRKEEYKNHLFTEEWTIFQDIDMPLETPEISWGNEIETCYGTSQVVSVKNPRAGISYAWFDSLDAKNPFALGTNIVLKDLFSSKIIYIEAQKENKKSVRIPIEIKLLEEIKLSDKFRIKKNTDGNYIITLKEKQNSLYYYNWYFSDGKQIPIFGTENEVYPRFNRKNEINIGKELPSEIYLQKVNNETTCTTPKIRLFLK